MYDNSEIINIEDFHQEKSFKEKAKEKLYFAKRDIRDLIVNRPNVVCGVLFVIGSAINANTKRRIAKSRNNANDATARTFYDARVRHHVVARRKLTSGELLELDRRYNNGENYAEILASMRLL